MNMTFPNIELNMYWRNSYLVWRRFILRWAALYLGFLNNCWLLLSRDDLLIIIYRKTNCRLVWHYTNILTKHVRLAAFHTSSEEDSSSSDELLSALAFVTTAGCFFGGAASYYNLSRKKYRLVLWDDNSPAIKHMIWNFSNTVTM